MATLNVPHCLLCDSLLPDSSIEEMSVTEKAFWLKAVLKD